MIEGGGTLTPRQSLVVRAAMEKESGWTRKQNVVGQLQNRRGIGWISMI